MAGNGFFSEGRYQPYSTETWADLTGGWDTYTGEWDLTPSLPLEFTSPVFDLGKNDYVAYLLDWSGVGISKTTTVYYGDTVDSAGGDIDSPTTITGNPGDTLSPVKGRYFQFKVSIDNDSAGEERPFINAITANLRTDKKQVTKADINSSTLGGSVGARELTIEENIQTVTSIVTQPHYSSTVYVADDYVATDYFEIGDVAMPKILVDKSTTPITLNIFELDTFGKTKRIDCVFDAMITGIAPLVVTPNGSIQRG
jgi:hypothetical protein